MNSERISLCFGHPRGDPETSASIETQLVGAGLRFNWRFDEPSPNRTRLTQRLTFEGVNAHAYVDQVKIFESTIPEGMKRIASVMEQAEPMAPDSAG